jgi:hypothetical protein
MLLIIAIHLDYATIHFSLQAHHAVQQQTHVMLQKTVTASVKHALQMYSVIHHILLEEHALNAQDLAQHLYYSRVLRIDGINAHHQVQSHARQITVQAQQQHAAIMPHYLQQSAA